MSLLRHLFPVTLLRVFLLFSTLLAPLVPAANVFAQRLQQGSSCPVVTGKPYRSPDVTTVFFITPECQKRPIFNPAVYFSHFAGWEDVIFLERHEIDAIPDHPLHFLPWGPRRTFQTNSLIKVTSDPRVYLLVNATLYPFESEAAFTSFGFTFDQVEDVTEAVIGQFQKQSTTLKSPDDAPASFVFKYENDPKVYLLVSTNGTLTKSHILTMEDLRRLARADRIGIFASSTSVLPEGTPTENVPAPATPTSSTSPSSPTPSTSTSAPSTSPTTPPQTTPPATTPTETTPPPSTPTSTQTPADTTAPTVSLSSPTSGATISGMVSVAATASDASGVTAVRFLINQTLLSEDATSPYAASLNTTSLSNGSHTLYAVARDPSGNAATSTITVTISNPVAPPTVAFTSPVNGATLSGTVSLVATASGGSAITSVQFSIDGTAISTDASAPYGASLTTGSYTNGTHTLSAIVTDALGNQASASVSVTFETAVAGAYVTRDAEGWTVVNPSPDSRVIYVSSSEGLDTNDGLSAAAPKRTIAAGRALLRDGYPDHLLLKSGDRWEEAMLSWAVSGRSAAEPMVVSSYGDGPRPSLQRIDRRSQATYDEHVYFMNLDLYVPQRDPNSPLFIPSMATSALIGIAWQSDGTDFHFENIRLRSFANGINVGVLNPATQYMSDIRFRRCLILDSYHPEAHSQGMYGSHVDGLLLEENIFDHNGWTGDVVDGTWVGPVPNTAPNIFNHNFYVTSQRNFTARGNLSLRPASMHMKFRSDVTDGASGITVDGNVMIGGELGVSIGGNAQGTIRRFTDINVRNNVITYLGRNITRNIGWGMELSDLRTGVVSGNLITNQTDRLGSQGIIINYSATDLTVSNNVIDRVNGRNIFLDPNSLASNIRLTGNRIQHPVMAPDGTRTTLVELRGNTSAVTFADNTYYTDYPDRMGVVNYLSQTFAQWTATTTDTGSRFEEAAFPDAARTPESYFSLMGGSGVYADFINTVRNQDKSNWVYTGPTLRTYLRAGYGM